ncbi:MAG: thioredoxin-dependent thiol peroxidase [Halobacteriales archaeon]|nr:thioredoxin-dependent thiol peroxidase [Halobacteriales archaeon]
MLETGDPAPEFTLPNHDGESVSLTDFAGSPLVVYFYPRADTPGCTTEACGFRDAWTEYADAGAAVVGISDDPVDELAAFRGKYELPFDLLSDEDGAVSSAYGSYGEKHVFGNVVDGVFRNTYLVDGGGRIAATYPKVDPEGHAEAVLADVRALT